MPTLEEVRDEAASLLAKGKYKEAHQRYCQLAAADPATPQWSIRVGELALALGDLEEAANAYRTAAEAYLRRGDTAKATAACNQVLDLNPTDREARSLLDDMAEQQRPSAPAAAAAQPTAPVPGRSAARPSSPSPPVPVRVRPASAAAAGPSRPPSALIDPVTGQTLGAQRSTVRILIVDDDPTSHRLIAGALVERRYKLVSATDGLEALAILDQMIPDLIITDVMMPRMDGWTFVQQLRVRPEFALIPVVFLTNLDSSDDRMRGFHLGADAYLSKPIQASELEARVTGVLRRWQTARQVTTQSVAQALPIAEGATVSGLLEHFGLAAVLSMIEVERKTGTLALAQRGRTAELDAVNGRLVRASVDGAVVTSLLDAICHLLGWRQGSFHFRVCHVEPGSSGPNAARAVPSTHLLQQALQRLNAR